MMKKNRLLIDEIDKEIDKEFLNRNLDREKQELIDKLKSIKKEDLFKRKEYTLWERIKKTLGF
jgi:hypothetical protein